MDGRAAQRGCLVLADGVVRARLVVPSAEAETYRFHTRMYISDIPLCPKSRIIQSTKV